MLTDVKVREEITAANVVNALSQFIGGRQKRLAEPIEFCLRAIRPLGFGGLTLQMCLEPLEVALRRGLVSRECPLSVCCFAGLAGCPRGRRDSNRHARS